jgi:hypothetical protein
MRKLNRCKSLTIALTMFAFGFVRKFYFLFFINFKKVIPMITASASPTIAQTLMAINNPQPVNINIGTADPEANAAAAGSSSMASSGSVGTCCGSSVDTYA